MRFSSPVSRKDSSETFAFWNQNRSALAVRAAKPVPAQAWGWVPGVGRGGAAEADLDPPDVIGGDEHVILDGPGQSRVQPGPEVTVDDPAEARADRDLARLHREEAAAEIEDDDGDARRRPRAARRSGARPVSAANQSRTRVHSSGTGVRQRLRASKTSMHHRGRDLHRLGHEARGLPEGRRRG